MDRKTVTKMFELGRMLLSTGPSEECREPTPGEGLAEIGRLRMELGLGPWTQMIDVVAILTGEDSEPQSTYTPPAPPPKETDTPPGQVRRSPGRSVFGSRRLANRRARGSRSAAAEAAEDPRATTSNSGEAAPRKSELVVEAEPCVVDADAVTDVVSPAAAPDVGEVASSPPEPDLEVEVGAEVASVEVAVDSPANGPDSPIVALVPAPKVAEATLVALQESHEEALQALHRDDVATASTLWGRIIRETARDDAAPELWFYASVALLGMVHVEPRRAFMHGRAALGWARRHHERSPSDESLRLLLDAITVSASKAGVDDLAAILREAADVLAPWKNRPEVAKIIAGLQLQLAQTNPFRPRIQSASFAATGHRVMTMTGKR